MEQLGLDFAPAKRAEPSEEVQCVVRIRPGTSEAILRLPEVEAATGLKRSTIYDRIGKGTFPAPVHLGKLSVGWPSSSIQGWIPARIREGIIQRGEGRCSRRG
jgi:prophage regulatory protein